MDLVHVLAGQLPRSRSCTPLSRLLCTAHATLPCRPPLGGGDSRAQPPPKRPTKSLKELNPVRVSALKQLRRIEEDAAFATRLHAPTAAVQEARDETDGAHTELDINKQVAALDAVLQRAERASQAAGRVQQAADRRRITNLVGSVTRWRRQLDVVISAMCRRSAGSLDSGVRQVWHRAQLRLRRLSLSRGPPVSPARLLAGAAPGHVRDRA